jgi:hypothetical protein
MLELAGGNFNVTLAGVSGRKDEIGDVANAVLTFKIKAEEKGSARSRGRAEAADRVMGEFDAAVGGRRQGSPRRAISRSACRLATNRA